MWMKIGWALAMLLLLGTGIAGIYNIVQEMPDAVTPLQVATSIGVGVYGVLGILATIGAVFRRRWALGVIAFWALSISAVSTMAPLAYAPGAGLVAVLAGGMAALCIGAAVYFIVRRGLRERPLP